MAEIRQFTKEDWYAWGGATNFKNGSEPLIYEQKLNDGHVDVTMIGDATGISIYMTSDYVDDDPAVMSWDWRSPEEYNNLLKTEGVMRAMIREFELDNNPYAPDVTYCLDHCREWRFEYQEV